MTYDPYDVAESACGAIIAILVLFAVYAPGSDRPDGDLESNQSVNSYATALQGNLVP